MVLLRRVIGDALRARRQGQHRTLREVSTSANVSLGYLSEIERGQKEASSELLAAICDALGAQLSDVIRQVSDTLAMAEEMESVLAPVGASADRESADAGDGRADRAARADAAERSRPVSTPAERVPAERVPSERVAAERVAAEPVSAERVPAGRVQTDRVPALPRAALHRVAGDGEVTVSVRHDTALRTTLRATRMPRAGDRDRDVVYAA
jgi:transcriptional regulator with XRE-family HTH domain